MPSRQPLSDLDMRTQYRAPKYMESLADGLAKPGKINGPGPLAVLLAELQGKLIGGRLPHRQPDHARERPVTGGVSAPGALWRRRRGL